MTETKNDLIKEFDKFLEKLDKYYFRMSYDSVDEDFIKTIYLPQWIKFKDNNKENLELSNEFIKELKSSIYESDSEYLYCFQYDEVVEEILSKFEEKRNLTEEEYKKIEEYFHIEKAPYCIEIDINFEDYLDYNFAVDVLMDYENIDKEGMYFCKTWTAFYDYLYKVESFNEKRFETDIDVLTKMLFRSQGYKFKDLFNAKKRYKSIFLDSFYNEINKNYGEGIYTYTKKMSLNDIKNTIENNSLTIEANKNNYAFGIFDPVNSTGSQMSIELEKDFKIDTKYLLFSNSENPSFCAGTIDVYGKNKQK